jgi:hypothetical protein
LNAEKTATIVQVFGFIFLIFAPDVDHLVGCEPDVKMPKPDNDGKAMISMYLSTLIMEINIYSGRNEKRLSHAVITSVEKWGYVQVLTDHSMSKPQNHLMQFSIEMKNEGNGHLSVREMRKIPGDY